MVIRVVSMVSKVASGSAVLIALLLVAPGGLAQVDAVGEAGGQATAAATGSYHADGSGAVDAANDQQQDNREKAANELRETGDAHQDTYAQASSETNASVERPTCDECRDAVRELEQEGAGSMQSAHAAEQAADVDNEYADAGVDAEASGEAQAWYHDLFSGIVDAFDQVSAVLEQDAEVDERAQAEADESLATEDRIREDVASTLEQEQELESPVDPAVDGELSGEHTSQAATSAVTEASSP